MTITLLLYFSDKDLEEIQQIVISTKATNLTKRIVGATVNLALIVKKKQPENAAMKSKPGEKYFNCKKKGHYIKDCYFSISNKRKPVKESTDEAKRF